MSAPLDALEQNAARTRGVRVDRSAANRLAAPAPPYRISIFGLGYVGAVSLACLARDGHEITGVDIDASKLELLRNGQAPMERI